MPTYNLEQYIVNDVILDLCDIIPDKLLLNSSSFTLFKQELNDFLLTHPNTNQLEIKPSLLIQLADTDSRPSTTIFPLQLPHIVKLKIKATNDLIKFKPYSAYAFGQAFYKLLSNNPQLKEIDCRDDTIQNSSTIVYPDRDSSKNDAILTLHYSGEYSHDTFHADDLFSTNAIHVGLLEYYYEMSPRERIFYFEWNDLKDGVTVQGLPPVSRSSQNERTWVGLKSTDPLILNNVSIPRIELPPSSLPPRREQATYFSTMTATTRILLQPSFIIALANQLFDQARNPAHLCSLSLALAGLMTALLPTNIVLAASLGVVSGLGFYALGRHSILPTRENAMQDYASVLGSYTRG